MELDIIVGTEKVSSKEIIPIAVITLSDEIVFVLEGTRGQYPEYDIKIKYKKNGIDEVLIPSHSHWVVDLIIKEKSNSLLSKEFISILFNEYNQTTSIANISRSFETIKTELTRFTNGFNVDRFSSLNQFGYYSVDFLVVLIKLFSIQEKTSSPTAFMFKSMLGELTKDEPNYFGLVAVASNVRGARL
ncbi:MAG: hypothetical protein PHP65_00385 [Bacilli bacterium]|nr:hypothetical protein [Bacilli bacterium]